MNCLFSGMTLLMAHKSLVDWQQLKLFFPILKQRVHLILREWENSHLQSRTSQLGSYTCCESHRNVWVLNLFACPCLVHDVQICSSEGKGPIVVVKEKRVAKTKRREERISSPWRKGNYAKMQKTTNSFERILFFIVNISMRKMTLEVEYFKSMI